MKKKSVILVVLILVLFLFCIFYKWDTNIYMELASDYPNKIDLQVKIDNSIFFDDTLSVHPLTLPSNFIYPLRMGYHDIEIRSNMLNVKKKERVFVTFNHIINIYAYGLKSKPNIDIHTIYKDEGVKFIGVKGVYHKIIEEF